VCERIRGLVTSRRFPAGWEGTPPRCPPPLLRHPELTSGRSSRARRAGSTRPGRARPCGAPGPGGSGCRGGRGCSRGCGGRGSSSPSPSPSPAPGAVGQARRHRADKVVLLLRDLEHLVRLLLRELLPELLEPRHEVALRELARLGRVENVKGVAEGLVVPRVGHLLVQGQRKGAEVHLAAVGVELPQHVLQVLLGELLREVVAQLCAERLERDLVRSPGVAHGKERKGRRVLVDLLRRDALADERLDVRGGEDLGRHRGGRCVGWRARVCVCRSSKLSPARGLC
jgi:hypothetical protein